MNYPLNVQLIDKSQVENIDFSSLPFGRTFSDHMFIADYYDGDWRDCRIVPYGDLSYAPSMMAIHYGQSIFEGMSSVIKTFKKILKS